MPERLGPVTHTMWLESNVATEDDGTPVEVGMLYEMPSTKLRMGYRNEQIKNRGQKVKVQTGETNQRYGMRIFRGFIGPQRPVLDAKGAPEKGPDGAVQTEEHLPFERPVDGGWVSFSSQQDSPHYWPEWRSWFSRYGSHYIEALADRVFNAPVRNKVTIDTGTDGAWGAEGEGEPGEVPGGPPTEAQFVEAVLPGDGPREEPGPDPLSSSQTTSKG